MSADFKSDKAVGVLVEVLAERKRQHARWGEQDMPDDTGEPGAVEQAALFKQVTDAAMARGRATWRQVLREEVFEAFAESAPDLLRAELVQVAAVAAAWIEAIDRRRPAAGWDANKSEVAP